MPLVKIRRTRARLHTNFATENDMATSKGNRRRKVRILLHRSVTGRDKSVARACSDASWREVREAIWRSPRSGSFSREAVSKKMSDTACAATWRGSSEDPTKGVHSIEDGASSSRRAKERRGQWKRGKACLGTERIESLCASSESLKRYWQPKEKINRFRKIHKSLWQVPKLVKLV